MTSGSPGLGGGRDREAALVKNHPPDLINLALERLVEASLELPAFSTLDDRPPPSAPRSMPGSSRASSPGWGRRDGSGSLLPGPRMTAGPADTWRSPGLPAAR
jgi:hypothetical protein